MQTMVLNQAQREVLNVMSCLGKDDDLSELKKLLVSFLNERLQRELAIRSTKNNPNRLSVYVHFSDKLHPFTISLEVELTIASFDYFCKEFKRQIILQIYDKQWKRFVLHMMGNLDRNEIEMLDGKYLKMIADIRAIILSRECR